jgi:hypothetical protein
MTCEGRNINEPPTPELRNEFKSRAYERVALKYGEAVKMSDPASFSAAAFRAQALRRWNRMF